MSALVLLLVSGGALAADPTPVDSRAVELAKLRRDVETLSSDLLLRKEDLRNRLKAVEAERLEIEVQIRREELRLAQLEDEAVARRTELAVHTDRGSALGPALFEAIVGVRATVEGGLPFHVAERLAELDGLRDQLERGLVSPEQGVARLWAFTEDELRLARENGLDRQVVPLPTGDVFADVARLGMVALYFRTDGGTVGCASEQGGRWTWRVLDAREDVLAVEALFGQMAHGVRTGAFQLPDPGYAP